MENVAAAHLRESLSFVNECLEYFGEMESARAPARSESALLALYGPITHVVRFTRSAALLTNQGHRLEAQVLARSAIEYALTIQYAYLRVDGLDRLEKTSIIQRRELLEDLAKWHHDPSYLEMIPSDQPKAGAKGMPKFTQILDVLDPDHVIMHATYAVLSQVTHLRPGSRTRFFEMVDDELTLTPGRDDDRFGNVAIGALAFAMMAATWVYARLTEDSVMLARLDVHSDRLRIPVRYDGDWSPSLRAHRD